MEERQQVLAEPPLVVGLRRRTQLRLAREPPPRRELVEGGVLAAGGHAGRPPYADLDLGEDLFELALSLAHRPAIGVGAKSDDLTPAVGADPEAVGGQPVLAIVCPNLTM